MGAVTTAVLVALYVMVAVAIITWKLDMTLRHTDKHVWPVFRRHGFRRDDLDASIAFGLLMLVFNGGSHAFALAGVGIPSWMGFAGATAILAMALCYLWWHRRTTGLQSLRRRGPVFFAPMLIAMAADQYLAKLAAALIWMRDTTT